MITRSRLLFGLLSALAAVLTLLQIPVASSQGVTVVAARVAGDLPAADPASALWRRATAVNVPLSAQNIARPMLPNSNTRSVTVRALHNGSQLALLVEWADGTRNDSMIRTEDFRDAVAVQFPLVEGQPFFCMGQQGGDVNIWHWKADWQADIIARQDVDTQYPNMYVDYYPLTDAAGSDVLYLPARAAGNLLAAATFASPVEDLIAGGFGSLTAQPAAGQNVGGYGEWIDGQWRAIFSRDLNSADAEDISFASGQIYPLAFAVWDGANGERNGQKSTSQWVSLRLEAQSAVSAAGGPAPAAVAAPRTSPATSVFTEGFVVMVAGMLVINLLCLVPAGAVLLLGALTNKKSR